MILLVPLGFGFSYMMIKLAKESERKAKLAKDKGPKKVSTINLSQKWINWLIVGLLAFQVFLNIAAYNAALTGMKNISLFFIGVILIVFAGFFHLYRYGLNQAKNAPPPPPVHIQEEKPKELAEPQIVPTTGKIPEGHSLDDAKKETKETPQISTPKIQADLGINADRNFDFGSPDLKKP
jgi:ubiquinol-cytochrome c reductase cytochrome b subunit